MTDEEFRTRLATLPGPPHFEEFEAAALDLYKAGTKSQKTELIAMRRNIPESKRLTAERRIARALRSVFERAPDEFDFLATTELQRALSSLEHFLPAVLSEVYPYWKGESLDGFFPCRARKIDSRKAEIAGACILISDQTLTLFELQLQIAPLEDKIDRLECRLGKRGNGPGEMERAPLQNSYIFLENFDRPIDWVYRIGFGAIN